MPVQHDLQLDQGGSFAVQFTYLEGSGTPVDLTTYTIKSQIRATLTSLTASAEFTCSVTNPTAGIFTLSMHPSSSALLTGSCYTYDVRLTSGSYVKYLLEGDVDVSARVTA